MMSEAFIVIAQSVSRLSPRKSGFNPWPDLVGFSLDRVAWEMAAPPHLDSPPSKALIFPYVSQISKTLPPYISLDIY